MSVASMLLIMALVALALTFIAGASALSGKHWEYDDRWRSLDDIAKYYRGLRAKRARRARLFFLFALFTFLLFLASIIFGVQEFMA